MGNQQILKKEEQQVKQQYIPRIQKVQKELQGMQKKYQEMKAKGIVEGEGSTGGVMKQLRRDIGHKSRVLSNLKRRYGQRTSLVEQHQAGVYGQGADPVYDKPKPEVVESGKPLYTVATRRGTTITTPSKEYAQKKIKEDYQARLQSTAAKTGLTVTETPEGLYLSREVITPTTRKEFITSLSSRIKEKGGLKGQKIEVTPTGYAVIPESAVYKTGFEKQLGTGEKFDPTAVEDVTKIKTTAFGGEQEKKSFWDRWNKNLAGKTTKKIMPPIEKIDEYKIKGEESWIRKLERKYLPEWMAGKKVTRETLDKDYFSQYRTGIYSYVREKPLDIFATYGAFRVVGLGIGGIGAGLATKGIQIARPIKWGYAIGLPALYGGSVYKEYKSLPTKKEKAQYLGRETVRFAAMTSGISSGTKDFAKISGYFRTKGAKYIQPEKIVDPKVMSGDKTFPTAPTKQHLSLFKESKYQLSSIEKATSTRYAPIKTYNLYKFKGKLPKSITDLYKTTKLGLSLTKQYYSRQSILLGKQVKYKVTSPYRNLAKRVNPFKNYFKTQRLSFGLGKQYYGYQTGLTYRQIKYKLNEPIIRIETKGVTDIFRTSKLKTKLQTQYYSRQVGLFTKQVKYKMGEPIIRIETKPLIDLVRTGKLKIKFTGQYYGRQASLLGKQLRYKLNEPIIRVKFTKPSVDFLKTGRLKVKLQKQYYSRQVGLFTKQVKYKLNEPIIRIETKPITNFFKTRALKGKLTRQYYLRQSKLLGKQIGYRISPFEYSRVGIKASKQRQVFKTILPKDYPLTTLRPPTGAWHAAPSPFKKTLVTQSGTSELPGMYTAPSLSTYFLKIQRQPYQLYSAELFPSGLPTALYFYPKSFRPIRGSRARMSRYLTEKAPKYDAYVPGIKTEVEALLPPEGQWKLANRRYYTKVEGVRVPIFEYSKTGKVPKSRTIRRIIESYSYRRTPLSSPLSYAGGYSYSRAFGISSIKAPKSSYKSMGKSYSYRETPSYRYSYQSYKESYKPRYESRYEKSNKYYERYYNRMKRYYRESYRESYKPYNYYGGSYERIYEQSYKYSFKPHPISFGIKSKKKMGFSYKRLIPVQKSYTPTLIGIEFTKPIKFKKKLLDMKFPGAFSIRPMVKL